MIPCTASKRERACVRELGHQGMHLYRDLKAKNHAPKGWAKTRTWALERAGGRCEARISPDCSGLAEHAHHRKLRSQGGDDEIGNLLAVCGFCHAHIHANPNESVERGFLIRSSAPA